MSAKKAPGGIKRRVKSVAHVVKDEVKRVPFGSLMQDFGTRPEAERYARRMGSEDCRIVRTKDGRYAVHLIRRRKKT